MERICFPLVDFVCDAESTRRVAVYIVGQLISSGIFVVMVMIITSKVGLLLFCGGVRTNWSQPTENQMV